MTGYTDSTAQHADPGPAIDELIAIDGDVPRPTIGRPVDRPTRCGSRRTLAVFEMTSLDDQTTRILRRPNGVIRDNLHAPTRRTGSIDRHIRQALVGIAPRIPINEQDIAKRGVSIEWGNGAIEIAIEAPTIEPNPRCGRVIGNIREACRLIHKSCGHDRDVLSGMAESRPCIL